MKKKKLIAGVITLALAMQTCIPYALATGENAAGEISVTKSGDSLTVTGPVAETAIQVFDSEAVNKTSNCTITEIEGVYTVDISALEAGKTYSVVIENGDDDKTYNFNRPADWYADFTKSECGLHRYREDKRVQNFDTNGAKNGGATDYSIRTFTSVETTYNEASIGERALHFSDDMRELKPTTNGNIEFNTHMSKYGETPAVAYISDAKGGSPDTYPDVAWGNTFQGKMSGYLIYYYGGGIRAVRYNNEQPEKKDYDSVDPQYLNVKQTSKDDGFTEPKNGGEQSTDDIWGVKSSIEYVDNSVVITYQVTDPAGKKATYTITDSNPVSDNYLIGLASHIAAACSGVYISNLSIYYSDDTVTYVKNARDEMTEWVNARKQQTGRTEINMVTLGGSITYGAGWSTMLAEYFGAQTGTTFNLINSGIGGTGSDYAAARLEKDVIEKQPDIVFLDHAVNDSAQKLLNHSQYMKTATNVEYIIRKLMAMENPPLIYMVDFTTEELLITDLRMDANYNAAKTAFDAGTLTYDFNYGDYKRSTKRNKGTSVTAADGNDVEWFIRKAYAGAAGTAAKFRDPAFNVRALPEDGYDYIAEYYDIPSINIHDFLKPYCSLAPKDENTTPSEANANNDYTVNVDYSALVNAYSSYDSNDNADTISSATDITTILPDKVHPNDTGKRLYGDYMIHLFETNPAYRFKPQTYNDRTLIGEDYAAVSGMKDVKLSKDIIEKNAKFSVTGELTIENAQNATYLSDGVTITNSGSADGTVSYTFKGRQFGADIDGSAKSITLDGTAYINRTMHAMYEKLNGLNHTFTITLAAGQSVELRRMFTDEDSIPNVGTAIASDDSSVVTLDITDYANAFVYRNTDGNDGDVYRYHGTTPWQKAHTHVSTTQESINYDLLSAQDVIGQLDEDNLWRPTNSTSVYDMSVLKRNSYYKAIMAKSNISLYVPEINTQSVSLLTVPFNTANTIKAKLVYSNGETQEATFTPGDTITNLKCVTSAGNPSKKTPNLYEITVTADSTKKLKAIQFAGNDDSTKMLILGVSLKPLTTGSDKIAAYNEAISDAAGNVIGTNLSGNGQKVTYTADVLNLAAVNDNYKVYLALYEGDRFVDVAIKDCEVNEKGRINADITLPSDSKTYKLKAFVWTNDDKIVPVKSAFAN